MRDNFEIHSRRVQPSCSVLRWSCDVFLLLTCEHVLAKPPSFSQLVPSGARPGDSLATKAEGDFDPWPVQVWTNSEEISITPKEEKGTFQITIAETTRRGPYLYRLHNKDGASSPKIFSVGAFEEKVEQEPNNNKLAPQTIDSLPVTINGRLDNDEDTDSYRLNLDAGCWLVAKVEAYSILASVDPFLNLYDDSGYRLSHAHDSHNLDPLLAYHVKDAGTFVLQIAGIAYPPTSTIRLAGGNSAYYRLTITSGPFLHHSFPPSVQIETKQPLHLVGWNLGSTGRGLVRMIEPGSMQSNRLWLDYSLPEIGNVIRLPLGRNPELVEREPNDVADLATPVILPCAVSGRIHPKGDVDRYRISATKDESFLINVSSKEFGFPLDAVLGVADASGKELQSIDDSDRGSNVFNDPSITWKAPAKGDYVVSVKDLAGRGSEEYIYRLELARPKPDFTASVNSHAVSVRKGGSTEISLSIARHDGHQASLYVIPDGLPEGVQLESQTAGAKADDIKFKLRATEEAEPCSLPIRFWVTETSESAQRHLATYNLLRNEPRGRPCIDSTGVIWLTVLPPEQAEPVASKK